VVIIITTRRRVITQKTTDFINIAAEAWNQSPLRISWLAPRTGLKAVKKRKSFVSTENRKWILKSPVCSSCTNWAILVSLRYMISGETPNS
jgi:hypothetical protein